MVDLIAPIVNFIVVVGVLWYFGRKPFADFFLNRSKNIETAISEAEVEALEASKILTDSAEKWNGSEAHAKEIREETQARLESFRERTLKDARAQAERIKKETQIVGQSEIGKARDFLQRQIAIQSVNLAREYVARHLSDKDRKRMVGEYAEIVGNGPTN